METPISPKVIVAAIVGFVLTAIVSNISAITPDMLDFLGPWKLFVLGTLLTLLTTLAAWWKSDPLRLLPADAKAAQDAALAAKQASLAATAVNSVDFAPATTFPKAAVDAAQAAAPADPLAEAQATVASLTTPTV